VDYENIIRYYSNKRLKDADAENDIFSRLMTNGRGNPTDLPLGEVLAEASVMMNAGTDTTTSASTNTIYIFYKHPAILQKLREELDADTGTSDVPSYKQVSNLPYFRACVEESLRIRPPSSFGLPRTVPKEGRMIAGKFVDEGVTVSVPTYTILRDAQSFDEPEKFNPEHWIDGDIVRMSKAHFPFSTGHRACIGRNNAYFEQLLLIATLVRFFDFEFETSDFELQILERFNSNPGEMFLTSRRRL